MTWESAPGGQESGTMDRDALRRFISRHKLACFIFSLILAWDLALVWKIMSF